MGIIPLASYVSEALFLNCLQRNIKNQQVFLDALATADIVLVSVDATRNTSNSYRQLTAQWGSISQTSSLLTLLSMSFCWEGCPVHYRLSSAAFLASIHQMLVETPLPLTETSKNVYRHYLSKIFPVEKHCITETQIIAPQIKKGGLGSLFGLT